MPFEKFPFLATLFACCVVSAYDIHTSALTPITEDAVPSGAPMRLVEGGRLRFAIAWNPACETNCGPYRPTMASIGPALDVLTNAFAHVFGSEPQIVDASDKSECAKWPHLLVLGENALSRQLGLFAAALPDQGFAIRTAGRHLVIVGNDSSQIPGYNTKPYEGKGSSLGTFYGALDFTERFLGVRYWFPGEWGTYWPARLQDFSVRPVSYRDAPHFNHRNGNFHFNMAVRTDAQLAKWEGFMGKGAVRKADGSFVRFWRDGGTNPSGGSHCPEPQRFAANNPGTDDTMFYRSVYGRWHRDPDAHVGNLWDLTNLDNADRFVDAIKAKFAAPQPKWDVKTGFGPLVNRTYISFGQCDTWWNVVDAAMDPVVRELGLVTRDDFRRGVGKGGVCLNDAPVLANVFGRFVQHLGRRVKAEWPDRRLYLLCYYNSKWPPTDPRWKLPDNLEISLCDHRMPRKMLNPECRAELVDLFREWYEATGNRPVARAWLYTSSGDLFFRAVNPEFVAEVPRALGRYLGRDCIFYDHNGYDDLWHFYYSCYAVYKSQWNPGWDVDAGIDEHWEPFYGKDAGRYLKAFHRLLKDTFVRNVSEPQTTRAEENSVRPSAAVVDELERLLSAAGAAVRPGSVEERRYRLFASPWPAAFAKRRREIASGEVEMPAEERRMWKFRRTRIDACGKDMLSKFDLVPDPYKGLRANLSMTMATPLNRYVVAVQSTAATREKPSRSSFKMLSGSAKAGFNALADFLDISVDGKNAGTLDILPTDIAPYKEGGKTGYSVALRFPEMPLSLRFAMTKESERLFVELVPEKGAKPSKVKLTVRAIPSRFEVKGGKTRFYGYRRQIRTAHCIYDAFSRMKPDTWPTVSEKDGCYVFQDADFDGSKPAPPPAKGGVQAGHEPEKGCGPCVLIPEFPAVESGRVQVTDYWTASVTFDLKPDFRSFRFALWENRDMIIPNEGFACPE